MLLQLVGAEHGSHAAFAGCKFRLEWLEVVKMKEYTSDGSKLARGRHRNPSARTARRVPGFYSVGQPHNEPLRRRPGTANRSCACTPRGRGRAHGGRVGSAHRRSRRRDGDGGPGHANAVGALFTALGAESPMVLLSGHAATWELGRGGFQELDQVAMAGPVTKASWMARSVATLAEDVGRAIDLARSGRPGPVHVSLPSDLLDKDIRRDLVTWPQSRAKVGVALHEGIADTVLAALQAAERPVILAGPHLSSREGRTLLAELEQATQVPAVVLESPRGVVDATIGAFADIMRRADLVLLLG